MSVKLNLDIPDDYVIVIREWIDGLHGSPQTAQQTKNFLRSFLNTQIKKNIKAYNQSKRAEEIELESEVDPTFDITEDV